MSYTGASFFLGAGLGLFCFAAFLAGAAFFVVAILLVFDEVVKTVEAVLLVFFLL